MIILQGCIGCDILMIIWHFTSLSIIIKSYRDNEGVISSEKALCNYVYSFVCLCCGFMAQSTSGVMSSTVSLPNHTFTGQA